MVEWESTLNTSVHAYETKTNIFMEAFQLKTCKYCVYCIYHAPLCIKIKLLIIVLVEVDADLDFCTETDFFCPPLKSLNSKTNRIDLNCFVRDPQMYTQLSLFNFVSI